MSMKISSVLGNGQYLDGGSMFGNAPRAVWQKWITPDEQGRIPLACRALLVQTEDQNILCETGIGAFFEPKLADRFGVQNKDTHELLVSLEKLKLSHEDIDVVILSHLHFDHAGGLLPKHSEIKNGNESLLFPKAKYIVSESAMARACEPHMRDRASFIPGLVDKLKASGRLIIVKQGETTTPHLPDGFEFIYSQGHTPGQMLTKVTGEKDSVLFTGDLIPGSHWVHLPITMGYDRYAEKIIDEKTNLYQTIDLDKTYLFYTHDSQVAASKVGQDEKDRYYPVEPQSQFTFYQI